ncbi:MAG: rhomboid family intramembrane serine protease [Burkholderiales bacterium]|nr:rhomboid family intramembrane serine protease [Burkholderiales bacterium]
MRVNSILIVANVVTFLLVGASPAIVASFALWPLGTPSSFDAGPSAGFAPWQLVTSAFLHGSLMHLALNMVGLYSFGRDVEDALGSRRYLTLYVVSVLVASFTQLLVVSFSDGPPAPTVGASGGVFGVLLAFGLMFPKRTVLLLIPPVPMPAWVAVLLFGAFELVNGVLGTMNGIAHFAHLGGMLGAFLLLRRWAIWRPLRG